MRNDDIQTSKNWLGVDTMYNDVVGMCEPN